MFKNKNLDNQEERRSYRFLKIITPGSLLLVGFIMVIFSPFLFSQYWGFIQFDSRSGNIGDTIGGITAPITSLIGSVLVFFALKAQIRANEIIQQQIINQSKEENEKKIIQQINEYIGVIRNDINEFTFTAKRNSQTSTIKEYLVTGSNQTVNFVYVEYKGSEALANFFDYITVDRGHADLDVTEFPKVIEFQKLIALISSLFEKIHNSGIPDSDKLMFNKILSYLFESKIISSFHDYRLNVRDDALKCKFCKLVHFGIPVPIVQEIERIENIISDINKVKT